MAWCEENELLHILPRPAKRIVWSWQAENGTVFQIPKKNLLSTTECFIELTNIFVAVLTTLVVAVLILKYKCGVKQK